MNYTKKCERFRKNAERHQARSEAFARQAAQEAQLADLMAKTADKCVGVQTDFPRQIFARNNRVLIEQNLRQLLQWACQGRPIAIDWHERRIYVAGAEGETLFEIK